MKSWKTTVLGILTILGAVVVAVKAMLDSDPSTMADWGIVATAVTSGLGFIFARDNKVTSEQANAK